MAMGLLWTIQDLERGVKSRHPEVQLWVADRLEEYFSQEAGPLMASLLQSKTEGVALRAASYFVRWPDPRFADDLFQAFETGKGCVLESCAQALAKLGDARFAPLFLERYAAKSVSLLEHAGVLHAMMELKSPEGIRLIHELLKQAEKAQEDGKAAKGSLERLVSLCAWTLLHGHDAEEMAFLLRYYLNFPLRETWGYLILVAFVDHAGAPYTREDLEKVTHKKAFSRLSPLEQDEIAHLTDCGEEGFAGTIQELLRKKEYTGVIRSLYQAAEAIFEQERTLIGELAMREWEKKRRQPLINLWLLRAIAGESALIEKTEPTVQRRLAITALVIFTRLLDCREFIGIDPERMTAETRMALLLKDREDIPEDEALIKLLSQEPHAGLISACPRLHLSGACLEKIQEDPGSPSAVRAVRLLGRLRTPEAIPVFLSILREEREDDLLCEAVEDALSRIGEPVLPALEPLLREGGDEEVRSILPLLDRLPYPGTVEMVLSHFQQLYEIDRESLLYAVEALGSAHFIPLLREYMKEDEPEEEVFALLCRIHDVHDPELPQIEQRLDHQRKEVQQTLDRLQAGDERALVHETIPLPLRCLHCRRIHTYRVREVLADHRDKELENIYIRDHIVCKQCGTENQYEITAEARLAITASLIAMMDLADAGKADLNEGPVKLATLMVDGRPMGPKEGVAYYQEQIARHPDRPDLRVGYGNLLLFWKREVEARAEFEKTVELDPLAVEALHSLAEMEIKSKRVREAYVLYQKCLDLFDRGHFYRMDAVKKEQFREHLEVTLWDLREEIGIKPAPAGASRAAIQAPLIRKEKTGRNDPCPCGSRRKYKKCCLGKEEAKAPPAVPQTMMTEEENRLIGRLVSFAASSRFREDYKKAFSLFFSRPVTDHSDLPEEKEAFSQFLEWFIYDYPLTGGATLIQEFARTQAGFIPPGERELLKDWIHPSISLYEVLESRPERAEIKLKDLFTGKELLIRDVSGSRQLVRWDLIGVRVFRVGEHLRASGVIPHFPPSERDSLIRFFTTEWERYQNETGERTWEAFMKARGYLLYHYTRSRKGETIPPLMSPEYHEMIFCKAHYDVENFHGAVFRLKQEFDFHLDEEGREPIRFTWLKRGKSKEMVPEGTKVGRGLIIQAAFLPTLESRETLSLGTLTLTERRLTLEAISRERLEAGKRRIEALLGDYIRFRLDTFQSVKAALKERKGHEQKEAPLGIPREEQEDVMRRILTRQMEAWIHTPIPALDGKTPLEMMNLPGGRERVEQLLKEVENMEERKKREGEFYVDINSLQKRLGLPSL